MMNTEELLTKAASTIERIATDHEALRSELELERKQSSEMYARLQAIEQRGGGSVLATPYGAPSLLSTLTKSEDFQAVVKGTSKFARVPLELELKNIIGSNAFPPAQSPTVGFDVASQRDGNLWGYPLRPLSLLDVLPRLPMSSNSLEFHRLTHTNAAAEQTTEGAQKAEAAFKPTLVEAKVATIAHWIPVSRQVIADMPMLEQQLRSILLWDVQQQAEAEIVTGSGTISGLITQGVAFSGTGANTRADRIAECIATMVAASFNPSHILLHPLDWYRIQTKTATTGEFVISTPASPIGPSLWNLPVIVSPAVTQNTGLVIDSSQIAILDRQQAAVEAGLNDTDFTKNLITLLAEIRIGLAIFNTSAVRKIAFAGSPLTT